MQFARLSVEPVVLVVNWYVAAAWAGLTVLVVVSGAGILRTAVVLYNKRMLWRPQAEAIAVPSWRYATLVTCVTLMADGALLGAVIWSAAGQWRAEWLAFFSIARLALHAVVLAQLLSARFREAMIVQIFEIAIVIVLMPVLAALVGVVFLP